MMVRMSVVDDRVRSAASQWGLTVGEELSGGARSAVFAATDGLGRDLVLKLPARTAANGNSTGAEAAALKSWARTGAAVGLIAATADALLLARARPGLQQPWRPEGRLDDTVEMAGELLRRLWSVRPGSFRYPTLSSVYAEDERVARDDAILEQRNRGEPDRGVTGLRRLPAAAAAAERLMATAPGAIVLHGDFITKNIFSDDTSPEGWVALDPLPMMGDPASEVASFAAYHPAELILPIAESLATEVDVAPQRALRWAAIWAVHQAAQAWREDQESLECLIATPTIANLLAF